MNKRDNLNLISSLIRAFLGFIIITLFSISCSMPIEEVNKQLIQEVYEKGINVQNIAYIDSILAENYVRHSQSSPPGMQEISEKATFLKFLEINFDTFPDWNESIEFMVAEGDKVALYTTGTATHKGKIGDLEPTGKRIMVKNLVIHRIDDNNRISETWVLWDNVAVLSQLGLYPPTSE